MSAGEVSDPDAKALKEAAREFVRLVLMSSIPLFIGVELEVLAWGNCARYAGTWVPSAV